MPRRRQAREHSRKIEKDDPLRRLATARMLFVLRREVNGPCFRRALRHDQREGAFAELDECEAVGSAGDEDFAGDALSAAGLMPHGLSLTHRPTWVTQVGGRQSGWRPATRRPPKQNEQKQFVHYSQSPTLVDRL